MPPALNLLSTIISKGRINSVVKTMSTLNTYCEKHCSSTTLDSGLFSPYTIIDRYNAFSFKAMSHKSISNADFWRIVALRNRYRIKWRTAPLLTQHLVAVTCCRFLKAIQKSAILLPEFTKKTIVSCYKCLPTGCLVKHELQIGVKIPLVLKYRPRLFKGGILLSSG